MLNRFKKILTLLLLIFNLVTLPGSVTAAPSAGSQIRNGLNETATEAGLKPPTGKPKEVVEIIGVYTNGLLNLMGFLFLILVIYGGALWMTAGGSEEKVTKAKKIIVNAAIGLAIILLAKAITFAVLELSRPATEQQDQSVTPTTPD